MGKSLPLEWLPPGWTDRNCPGDDSGVGDQSPFPDRNKEYADRRRRIFRRGVIVKASHLFAGDSGAVCGRLLPLTYRFDQKYCSESSWAERPCYRRPAWSRREPTLFPIPPFAGSVFTCVNLKALS